MCLPWGLLAQRTGLMGTVVRARGQHRLWSSIPRECVPGAARECRKHFTCPCALALEAPRAPGQGSESPGLLLLLLSHLSPVRLCDPIDGSPPGSSVPGILQARTLEWVAISFSNACMHAKSLQLCPTVQPHRQQPIGLFCPQDSLGKNTRVGFQGRGLEAPGSLGTGNKSFQGRVGLIPWGWDGGQVESLGLGCRVKTLSKEMCCHASSGAW